MLCSEPKESNGLALSHLHPRKSGGTGIEGGGRVVGRKRLRGESWDEEGGTGAVLRKSWGEAYGRWGGAAGVGRRLWDGWEMET